MSNARSYWGAFPGPLLLLVIETKEKWTLKLEAVSAEHRRRIGNSITGLCHQILLPASFGTEENYALASYKAGRLLDFDWLA